jgi:hypothetical protein
VPVVKAGDTDPYHEDSESERGDRFDAKGEYLGDSQNLQDSDEDPQDESDTEEVIEARRERGLELSTRDTKTKELSLGIEEFTPRTVKCLNCKQFFDLKYNKNRDCVCHSGRS